MPRTKVSKVAKRNRDTDKREESVRNFERILDEYLNTFEIETADIISEVDNDLVMLLRRTTSKVLQMKMGDFLSLKFKNFDDFTAIADTTNCSPKVTGPTNSNVSLLQSICSGGSSATLLRSTIAPNPKDEGYLTEDSCSGGSRIGGSSASSASLAAFTGLTTLQRNQSQQQQQQQHMRLRTPGPLSSAQSRRPRRSRSASNVPGSAIQPIRSSRQNEAPMTASKNGEHASRNRLRTPMPTPRPKAFSADRGTEPVAMETGSPPTALMRWPKPGEMVMSMCGSPVVAQVMQDKYANVNIPVRNGVLSLRPKRLAELQPGLIDSIDPETLKQIKTLHANLDLIVSMADKANANQ